MLKREVNRDTDQDDYNARNGRRSTIDEQDRQDPYRADQVKQGNERIAKCAVRAFDIRLQPSQAKYAGNGENVKDERRRDNVVEQVAVKVSIGSCCRPV